MTDEQTAQHIKAGGSWDKLPSFPCVKSSASQERLPSIPADRGERGSATHRRAAGGRHVRYDTLRKKFTNWKFLGC